jgi:LuxR family maltose regulon positive regulatory protein
MPVFLQTKFSLPYASKRILERPRLRQKLDAASGVKLLLVSAPPGAGKTTLLADWLRGKTNPPLWIALDSFDDNPASFWAAISTRVKRAMPEPEGQSDTPPQGFPLVEANQQTILDILNDLEWLVSQLPAGQRPLYLVLDDFHRIGHPAIFENLLLFIERLPEGACLVLSSRVDPPFPTGRLRASGALLELRLADLQFTDAEVSGLFRQVYQIPLTKPQVHRLNQRTEGWAAGLQLAGLSLQTQPDVETFLAHFSGQNRYVLELLSEEVFNRLDQSTQTFLLKTAPLEPLNAELCSAVTGLSDAGQRLEKLEKSNLFIVPLDAAHQVFRYHPLFADLLLSFLREQHPDWEKQSLRLAAEWCAQHGQVPEAVAYALKAGLFEQAAAWLEELAPPMTLRGEYYALASQVSLIPAGYLPAHPLLLLFYSLALYFTGQPLEAQRWLAQATAVGDPQPVFQATALLVAAMLKMQQGDNAGALAALQQAQAVPSAAQTDQVHSTTVLMFASAMLVPALLENGQIVEARQSAHQALEAANRTFPRPEYDTALSLLYIYQGDACYQLNDLDSARSSYTSALGYCQRSGNRLLEAKCCSQMALIECAFLNQEAAADWLAFAETIVAQRSLPRETILMDTYRIKVWRAFNELDKIEQWLTADPPQPASPLALPHQRLSDLNRTRAWLALSKPSPAQAILQRWAKALHTAQPAFKLEWHLLMALSWQLSGHLNECHEHLRLALLAAGQPVRVYLDENPALQPALVRFAQKENDPSLKSAALSLIQNQPLPAQAAHATVRPAPLLQPLSERELEVLRLVAQGSSNQAIAASLVIELGTVKRHVYNLFTKLDVQNRTEAVHRARELGLIE